jgi:ATP-dependent Zn protease
VTISTEYCSHSINFPDEYKAIMFKITRLNIDIGKGKQFNTVDKYGNKIGINNAMFSYSLNTNEEIKLSDEIFVRQNNDVDKSNDLKSSIEFYNLYIYSYTLQFTKLKQQVDSWINEYKKFVREFNDGHIYYFSYLGGKRDATDKNLISNIKFESHKFYSNKNFKNIFFEQKSQLIKRLDYFINNELEYKKLGIPYTFGLLFYGAPGCGKTSSIKAIANYTGRHIIEIPLSKIKTCDELKKILFSELINEHYVPANLKIIVLEDIDCMGSIVQKRESDNNEDKIKHDSDEYDDSDNSINSNESDDNISDNERDNQRKLNHKSKHRSYRRNNYDLVKNYKDNTDKLTLSYLLNLIDGVLEQRGRIIIVTTNHPEKLDSALLRPGRIDMKIDFKKCSRKICKEILEFYFNKKIKKLPKKIYNAKWTPAEVFEKCLNLNNFDAVLSELSQ